jgi:hypothetical protein
MPAISTFRVDRSMKNRTRKRLLRFATRRRGALAIIQSRDNPIGDTLVASAMDEQLFSVLVRECGDALKTYIAEAEKTCAMLNECKGKRLDTNDQRRIMAQRSTENEAHQRYMLVRERLFEIAHVGHGSVGA